MTTFDEYLTGLGDSGVLTPDHVSAVRKVWRELSSLVCDLGSPSATTRFADGILLCWDTMDLHADIEVYASGEFEWFIADRVSGEYDGSEEGGVFEAPAELVYQLTAIAADHGGSE